MQQEMNLRDIEHYNLQMVAKEQMLQFKHQNYYLMIQFIIFHINYKIINIKNIIQDLLENGI